MIPFLSGQTLFFSASPKFESNLMNELFDCNKYLKIPFDTLWKMRVRDRKFIIARHNKDVEEKNGEGEKRSSTDIDRFTDLDQANQKNRIR